MVGDWKNESLAEVINIVQSQLRGPCQYGACKTGWRQNYTVTNGRNESRQLSWTPYSCGKYRWPKPSTRA